VAGALLLIFRLYKIVRHCADKLNRAGRYGNVTFENGVEVVRLAVENLGIFLVLSHAGAVKGDAGEDSFAARVAQQFGVHLPVGGCLAAASHRSGGGRGVGADFEFVLQQILKAALVNGDEDERCRLAANLKSERTAGHTNEDRPAPAMAGTARNQALTVLGAENKCPLEQ